MRKLIGDLAQYYMLNCILINFLSFITMLNNIKRYLAKINSYSSGKFTMQINGHRKLQVTKEMEL